MSASNGSPRLVTGVDIEAIVNQNLVRNYAPQGSLTKEELTQELTRLANALNQGAIAQSNQLGEVREDIKMHVDARVMELFKELSQRIETVEIARAPQPQSGETDSPPIPVPDRYWAQRAATKEPGSFAWQLCTCLDALSNPSVNNGWATLVVAYTAMIVAGGAIVLTLVSQPSALEQAVHEIQQDTANA
jgi:hypothetical protein